MACIKRTYCDYNPFPNPIVFEESSIRQLIHHRLHTWCWVFQAITSNILSRTYIFLDYEDKVGFDCDGNIGYQMVMR